MDALGVLFFSVFFGTMAFTYFFFLKKLKAKGEIKKIKIKFIVALICILTPIIIILIYFCFEFYFIGDLLNFKIKNNYLTRITRTTIIFSANSLINFYLLNFYLIKISKENEIELIGTE
ncbi:hypothetical protein ACEN2I_01005 [Flavobacterium sp. W22_SRS_FK3]|uniref:hypothetical protein n=1 Tax=Flavobacterium sp. W22_SRS_FK3 TaxID=3240275 RepID=UPI003F930FBF